MKMMMKAGPYIVGLMIAVSGTFAEQKETGMEKAVFAAGCFWGVESIFQQIDGVSDTTVGYVGGKTENPTYKEVCYKDTGHAEAVEIVYDPSKVSYETLLDIFWRAHDPTTLNRQGPDVGSQYRSAIFYNTSEQKAAAEKVKTEAQKKWKKPIVTEISPASTFYPAEDYHQDYFSKKGIKKSCHFLRD
jgi:peptide-methionine (S)-S-oxide reductase